MQLKYLMTVLEARPQIHRISCMAWSPNNAKLAVVTPDRLVMLFDENGTRKDKFTTKPSDPAAGKASYVIREVAFSGDSTRLAVAQSDNIVFVYKLGEAWNEKKVICNKFPLNSSVAAMLWLANGTIVAGLEDGKVKGLNCKTNKSQNLFGTESSVVALAAHPKDGGSFLSSHDDGSIVRYSFSSGDGEIEQSGKIIQCSGPAIAIAWTLHGICVTGIDKKVCFYDNQGRVIRTFDYTRDDSDRDFSVAVCSPNGQTVAIGGFNRIRIYSWVARQNAWIESATKDIPNLYTVTALAWRKDGARLSLGSLCGAIYTFESVLRRTLYQDKFELTYIAPSQVVVKSVQEPTESITIESNQGHEIDDVRLMGKDNYLVARTEQSLILSDLTRSLQSEISWANTGRHERFYFENPNVCLIFNAGELSLVEYGEDYILGSVRTEFVNPHVISVRLNERGNSKNNKKLAYLLDLKTICVIDLIFQTQTQISNDTKIDWLELNETATKMLFRDKKMRLTLVDINSGRKQVLLNRVSFVQWVIQSDVAVAQSESNLIVWYNVDMPEHLTTVPIRGDVIDVTREDGKTTVQSTDGPLNFTYDLDEGLVEFGTAVNDYDFGRAISFLESLGDTAAATAMWHNLANIAMQRENLVVAQRCYAALGNVTRVLYLQETREIGEKYEETTGGIGMDCAEVKARVALLNSDLRLAEQIYLEHGQLEAAIEMYKGLRRWDDAISLAQRRGYHKFEELREELMNYLLTSGQEEKAGKVLEDQGETDKALMLYMKANKPGKAARLALRNSYILQDEDTIAKLKKMLVKQELFELAGDLLAKIEDPQGAIQMYRKGSAYARAIELARNISPDEVVQLEEQWGDWLVSKRQMDASISHYIEAGATVKALDAAVAAKQWKKAVQIARVLDDPVETKKYALDLSNHLAFSGDIQGAESLLVRAELYKEAVDFLNKQGQWDRAYELAVRHLEETEAKDLFLKLVDRLESEGKYKDCEKILISIGEPDTAISMYKRLEHYDAMIRLVEKFHRDLLENTHMHLARQLESRGKFKTAEVHYLAASDWKAAVHMYCNLSKWEDAHRIAKSRGGEQAANQVAYMWAKSLHIDSAARLLTKMGILENAIDFACDSGHFNFALELCSATNRAPGDVHLKRAMALEDEGKFEEAEKEFMLANKPREAIMMYTHNRDWDSAVRIAEKFAPETVNEILVNQAAAALESQNYSEYEALLIRAERPEIILEHYKEYEMWPEACRVAKEYVPSALPELQRLQKKAERSTGVNSDYRNVLSKASELARNEEFKAAADVLMMIQRTDADAATSEKALIRAAEICNQFLEGADAMEIARELGPKLVQLNHIGPAAQLYLAAEMPKEAVEVFIQTDNWSKARRLAKEIDPQMVQYVEREQKNRLKSEGNVEQLADIDISGALDLLAEQGQWVRCIEKSKQHGGLVLQKYLALYAAHLIREGDCILALALYLTNGAPANPQNFNIYHRIAVDCFSVREPDETSTLWRDLRNFLYNVWTGIKGAENLDGASELFDKFENLLLIANFYANRAACRQIPALNGIAVKISIALLRYTETIPVDKAFFEAGQDLRSVGRDSEAFVLLNHYLDVCEAIDEGSGALIDHSDLASTDFPASVPIPEELHLKNELKLHEEVREWVLAISMDQKVDQMLPVDDRNLFESSLGISDSPCVLSGYPVAGRQPVTFQRSEKMSNRDLWSKIAVSAKMSPQTDVPEVIEFLEKWLGAANFVGNH